MANETQITIAGNATNAQLRFAPSGKAVCNFSLASQPRMFDKQRQEWVDGETMWLSCAAWGELGENLIETMGDQKSLRVIVQGRLNARSYTTKEGDKRTVFEVDVEDVGPSLRWATATVQRSQRQGQRRQEDPWQPPSGRDPWAQTHHDQRPQQAQSDAPPF